MFLPLVAVLGPPPVLVATLTTSTLLLPEDLVALMIWSSWSCPVLTTPNLALDDGEDSSTFGFAFLVLSLDEFSLTGRGETVVICWRGKAAAEADDPMEGLG